MEIKKTDLTRIIVIGLLVMGATLLGVALLTRNSSSNAEILSVNTTDINIDDETNVVEVNVKGGYSPSYIEATAGKKTILKLKTDKTFDCSAAFQIPELNYSKFLPPTGETLINLGIQEAGTEFNASCSMGMYLLKIKFI